MNECDIGEGANRQWNKIKFRDELKSPALQEDSLPAEPPGKPYIENSNYLIGWSLELKQ